MACMTYVDLNPIRASIENSPEASDFTSAKKRIDALKATKLPANIDQQANDLLPFAGNPREGMPEGLPFKLDDYLQLVDWTGRILRDDKRGSISESLPPILERLNIPAHQWLYSTRHFESRFKCFVGTASNLKDTCLAKGLKRIQGLSACSTAFP